MIYYGQPSCEPDVDRYLESLKFLWRRRSQSRETPVIINTMGWVKGQLRSTTTHTHTSLRDVRLTLRRRLWARPQGSASSCWWT